MENLKRSWKKDYFISYCQERKNYNRGCTVITQFFTFSAENPYKEPAVRVPSLQHLSKIAYELGLDMEERELIEYQGEFLVPMKP